MSNPVITRLGVNQFWYNHWFSSNNYSANVTQDSINETFIKHYIDYGVSFNNNIFIHEHWHSKKFRKIRTHPSRAYMQYYRRHYYSNDVVGIEHSYLIRYKTGEYFPLRTWYMKFGGWSIISIQWFKPDKVKNSVKFKTPYSRDVTGAYYRQPSSRNDNRFNLYHAKLLLNFKSKKLFYNF